MKRPCCLILIMGDYNDSCFFCYLYQEYKKTGILSIGLITLIIKCIMFCLRFKYLINVLFGIIKTGEKWLLFYTSARLYLQSV